MSSLCGEDVLVRRGRRRPAGVVAVRGCRRHLSGSALDGLDPTTALVPNDSPWQVRPTTSRLPRSATGCFWHRRPTRPTHLSPDHRPSRSSDVGMTETEGGVPQDGGAEQGVRRRAQDDDGQATGGPPPWPGHRLGCESSRKSEEADRLRPRTLNTQVFDEGGVALPQLGQRRTLHSDQLPSRVHGLGGCGQAEVAATVRGPEVAAGRSAAGRHEGQSSEAHSHPYRRCESTPTGR